MEVTGLSISDAIQSGREDLVKEILQKDVDLEKPNGSSEELPLIQACYYGYPEIVALLLEKKANVNAVSKKGMTPLMVACDRGFDDIAEILLQQKPDLKKTTPKDRETALMFAASSRNFGLVKRMIKAGADPDQEDADGRKASGYSWHESDVYKYLRALEKSK